MGSYYNGFDTKSALKRWLFSGTPAIVPVALTNQAVAQGGQLVDVLNGQYTTPNSKFSDGWAEATLIRESDNGIMVRATLDHVILAVLSPTTSAIVLYEWTGNWSALGSAGNVYPDDGRPVLVRLQVVGTRARVYCNGVLALDVNTLTYTGEGDIGLRRTAGPGIVAEDLRSQYSEKNVASFPPPFGGIEGGFVLDLNTGRVLLEELVNEDGAANAGRWFNPNGGVAVAVGKTIVPSFFTGGAWYGNNISQSKDMTQVPWTGLTRTSGFAAPDGSLLGTKCLNANGQGGQSFTPGNFAYSEGHYVTYSMWLKKGTTDKATFGMYSPGQGFIPLANISVEVLEGDATIIVSGIGAIATLTNKWSRIAVTFKVNTTDPNWGPVIYVETTSIGTGKDLYAWGGQLVDGAEGAGAYTQTEGTAAPVDTPPYYNPGNPFIQGIAYDQYGSMHVEEVVGGPLPAGTAFINGRPVTKEGKLVVDNTGAITGFLPGGVPHTASGAVAVEGDPVGTVLALADPFFAAPLGQVWSGVGVADYDLATVWFSGAASESEIVQDAAFYAAAIPVTFYARLKTALAQTATVTLIAGAATIGTISIPSGQLLGTVRIVLPAGVAKTAKFKVTLTTAGTKYIDLFDGPLTGWERGYYTPNGAALTPLAGEAYTQDGKIYAGPVAVDTVFPPGADILNGSVFGVLDANAAAGIGLVGRFTTTNAVMCQKESGGLVTYEWTGNWSVKGTVALPPTAIIRMDFEGNFVHIVVNDVEQAVYPLSNATVAGRMGILVGSTAPNGPMFDSLGVEGGGVFIESFAGYVLEADGGPPSTPNPYFDGSTGWAPTAYVAGNKLTIPAGINPICNTTLPGTVAVTDSVVVRCYVEKGDPNLFVARGQGNTRYTLVEGWNTIDVTPVPAGANAQNMYIVVDGISVADVVIHFFIAIKL